MTEQRESHDDTTHHLDRRIENPLDAWDVALASKSDRDMAATARRAMELINATPGTDIDKINTIAGLKDTAASEQTGDKVPGMAYGLMHPVDNFPGTPTPKILTAEQALESEESMSRTYDSFAQSTEDRKQQSIEAAKSE